MGSNDTFSVRLRAGISVRRSTRREAFRAASRRHSNAIPFHFHAHAYFYAYNSALGQPSKSYRDGHHWRGTGQRSGAQSQ